VVGAAVVVIGALLAAGTAVASGGNYVFQGGSAYERQQVVDALNASSFNWSLVAEQITIVIAPIEFDESTPGKIFLDPDLLDSGQLSWGVVQNEYANQVDFFLLPNVDHAIVNGNLGGSAWCYADEPGLPLSAYGCERFASTLAWSYWQSPGNCMRPSYVEDAVSAAMEPATFRALIASILGPGTQTAPTLAGVVQSARQPRFHGALTATVMRSAFRKS
jgi:hypothetical protein